MCQTMCVLCIQKGWWIISHEPGTHAEGLTDNLPGTMDSPDINLHIVHLAKFLHCDLPEPCWREVVGWHFSQSPRQILTLCEGQSPWPLTSSVTESRDSKYCITTGIFYKHLIFAIFMLPMKAPK